MKLAKYRFNERLWTAPGMEIDYTQTEELKDEIIALRRNYPELSHWGDLAFFMAWGAFSRDHNDLAWSPITGRDEKFLGYLYHLEEGKDIFRWSEDSASEAMAKLF